jgi:hypothetical protein
MHGYPLMGHLPLSEYKHIFLAIEYDRMIVVLLVFAIRNHHCQWKYNYGTVTIVAEIMSPSII